jgi:uncharacterized protein YjeT (DUF2065 family)
MVDKLSLTIIVLAGIYLLVLAGLAFIAPSRATSFLGSFASSASAHYLELAIRLAVGAALLQYALHMQYSKLFLFIGWILIITTILLLAIPWQWHHRIAKRAVPFATAKLGLFGLSSAVFGGFVLFSALRGAT